MVPCYVACSILPLHAIFFETILGFWCTGLLSQGGLQQVSWFQLLPAELDSSALSEKGTKIEEPKDAATRLVLSAHIRLQNEGFLSTWTNSFVGPWDPSQGIYNPDEKIKLWIFLPGRHTSINPTAQAAACGLKVVGAGLWSAPGDSEEVAIALSQALRNCIERAFRGFSYVRFGDVFVKCRSLGQNEMHFRKPLPTCEFIFSASEEGIFVHVVVSGKRIRSLSSDDMEGLLRKQYYSTMADDKFAVVVAPHGMMGRLTGCCPSDLVRRLYQSKMKASNDISGTSLPFHVGQSSYGKIRGQTCYAEVSLGCLAARAGKASQINSNLNRNDIRQDGTDMSSTNIMNKDERKQGCLEYVQVVERTFIYPVEAVLVPMMPVVLARTCLRRCWLQDWAGTSWLENGQLADLSSVSSSISGSMFGIGISDAKDSLESSWIDSNGLHPQNSSNSNSSSSSSGSSSSRVSVSSGESDGEPGIGSGELEADADSLASKQSHLTSAEQTQLDGSNILQGGKRGRSNGKEVSQPSAAKTPRKDNTIGPEAPGFAADRTANDTIKSGGSMTELNAVGLSSSTAGVARSLWDCTDDDGGMGMDIQTVLAEFGDFGDFFEDDAMGFGEPPGTAESEAFMYSIVRGDEAVSPGARGMDTPDQMVLPVINFASLDSFSQHPTLVNEVIPSGNNESSKDARSSQAGGHSSGNSTVEVDSLPKAEAMLMFAHEYTAVQTPGSELGSSIFKSPYIPESRKMQNFHSSSKAYVYGATPPPSPCLEISDQKSESPSMGNGNCKGNNDMDVQLELKKHYRHVQAGKQVHEKPFPASANCTGAWKGDSAFMSVAGFGATNIGMPFKSKEAENGLGAGGFLITPKTVLATEIECVMLQAAMCRIRHTAFSCMNIVCLSSNKQTGGTLLNQSSSAAQFHESMLSGKLSAKQEHKKKECIPVRIAGDVDEEMHDGPCTAQVGVWRPVLTPKPSKSSNVLINDSIRSAPYNTSEEEGILSSGQKQPLHELLDAMPFLVQQAAISMDISLDGDCGDGPFGWLAYQEQHRRRCSCGPSMIHAGCGGFLAICHFLDSSGVELMDHLSADVSAATVITLLHSDVRMALKTAFGETNLDGPLSIGDWCRGRVQLGDVGPIVESYSSECTPSDSKETTSTVTVAIGEPITPPQCSAGGSVSLKGTSLQLMDNQMCEIQRGNKTWNMETVPVPDGARLDDGSQKRTNQETYNSETELQMNLSRNKPALLALPVPALLVGYQDDWLKASSRTLQLWEKAPLEPYALPKPVTYYAICPNIDPLLAASADFFQQLGSVYEACKLGTHVPVNIGGQIGFTSGRWASSGIVPIDCPPQFQKAGYNSSFIGSISDYLVSLAKGWDVSSFRKSLSKALKTVQVPATLFNQKDSENGSCMVIYIVCPFVEPSAILQTVVEACSTLGSMVTPPDKEKRLLSYNQVGKALNYAATLDETQNLSVPTLFGFSVPKLVLQVVNVETIFRVNRPPLTELVTLKETAFTVYNKARRIPRWTPVCGSLPPATPSVRVRPGTLHMAATVPGLWKDCVISRTTGGPPSLSRDNALEVGCLRSSAWDNSWQTRHGESNASDPSGPGESVSQEDVHYLFEPLFILAEPGSLDLGVSLLVTTTNASDSLRTVSDDASGSGQPSTSSGPTDIGLNMAAEGSESDSLGAVTQKTAGLHCCYGWTEDWQWLVCVWTDGRGELLDVHIFPFGGTSGRQDTKGLHSLFIQVLQQGCQILSTAADAGGGKPRNIVIARIGCFYELECEEWQKAIFAVGGNEVKKWPLQLRRFSPDGSSAGGGGSTLQQQEINLIQERILPPSPSPSSSLFSSHPKSSSFVKGSLVQTNTRKQVLPGHSQEVSKGPFQWVQSVSLVGLCIDHSLQLVCPAEMASLGGSQGIPMSLANCVEGLSPVKSLASTSVANLFVPSHGLRFIPPMPLQLPNCLTSESPPLAHLLHSKGSAFPFATGFVVSRATPSIRRDCLQRFTKEEWPSTLMVNLVDYYGVGSTIPIAQQGSMPSDTVGKGKQSRISLSEGKDCQAEAHQVLERVAVELNALSWLTVSPTFLERRTALPVHCDMVQRLQRLLHYAAGDFGLPGSQEKR